MGDYLSLARSRSRSSQVSLFPVAVNTLNLGPGVFVIMDIISPKWSKIIVSKVWYEAVKIHDFPLKMFSLKKGDDRVLLSLLLQNRREFPPFVTSFLPSFLPHVMFGGWFSLFISLI